MQGLLPGYLEGTLDVFVKNQEQLREQVSKSFEGMNNMNGMFPTSSAAMEEMNRQNIAMFERTMKMFTPFGVKYGADEKRFRRREKVGRKDKTSLICSPAIKKTPAFRNEAPGFYLL